MNTTIKTLNEKTDNRFTYAIGLFCLLSICMSQFPEASPKSDDKKTKIMVADKTQELNRDIIHYRG